MKRFSLFEEYDMDTGTWVCDKKLRQQVEQKTQFQAKTCNQLHNLLAIMQIDLFEATKAFNSHTISAQKLTSARQNGTEVMFQLLLCHCWL